MKLYVIKHKETGKYLKNVAGKGYYSEIPVIIPEKRINTILSSYRLKFIWDHSKNYYYRFVGLPSIAPLVNFEIQEIDIYFGNTINTIEHYTNNHRDFKKKKSKQKK